MYFVKCTFCIYWWDHVVFLLSPLIFEYWTILTFPRYSHGIFLFNIAALLVFYWVFLHLFSWGILVCTFLCRLVWFWYAGLIKWVGKCSFLFYFWEEIMLNWCYFFFNSLIKFACDVSGMYFFEFILFRVCWAWISVCLSLNLRRFQLLFLQINFLFHILLSFHNYNGTSVILFGIIPYILEALCFLCVCFFLNYSLCI